MKYVLFPHMFRKHFPKFPFLKDTRIGKNTNQLKVEVQLKVFDSSSIIDDINKKRVI